jgi:hypothetical protein
MWPGVPPTLVAHPLLGPIGQVDHRQGFKLHRSMSSRAFAALLRDERAYKEDPNHARWKRMNKRAHDVLYGEAGTCTTWDNVVAARSDASKIDDFYGYKASQTTVANKWSCFADSG